jgi:hypothetical protein
MKWNAKSAETEVHQRSIPERLTPKRMIMMEHQEEIQGEQQGEIQGELRGHLIQLVQLDHIQDHLIQLEYIPLIHLGQVIQHEELPVDQMTLAVKACSTVSIKLYLVTAMDFFSAAMDLMYNTSVLRASSSTMRPSRFDFYRIFIGTPISFLIYYSAIHQKTQIVI